VECTTSSGEGVGVGGGSGEGKSGFISGGNPVLVLVIYWPRAFMSGGPSGKCQSVDQGGPECS